MWYELYRAQVFLEFQVNSNSFFENQTKSAILCSET